MNDYNSPTGGNPNPYRPGGDNADTSWQGSYYHSGPNVPPPEPEKPYSYQFSDYDPAPSGPEGGDPKPPKKGKRGLVVFFSIIAVIVVVSLVSFTGYGVYVMMTDDNFLHQGEIESSSEESSSMEENASAPRLDIASAPTDLQAGMSDGGLTNEAIAAKVSPSTVRITNYQADSQYGIAGEGTGIILSSEGYIVTNEHVIEGATGLTVTLGDNESYNAKLVGEDTLTDLAVIKLEADPMPALTPAEFGDSDALSLGERVIAIGNAGGSEFAGSVTGGMISGLNRQITNEANQTLTVLQTDAAINPGNSGGPLINKYGQVIGINSAKYTREYFEGIGFAIPSNIAKPIVDDLIRYGRVTGRARLGAQFYTYPITGGNGVYLGLPSNVTGLLVLGVDTDCDIAKKGVVAGDVLMTMDGTPIDSFSQLQSYIINEKKPGDEVVFEVYRPAAQRGMNGRSFSVTVTLDEDTGETNFAEETPQVPEQQEEQQPQIPYGGDDGSGLPFPFFPFY